MFQRSKKLQELIFELEDSVACQNSTVVLSKLALAISELYREFGRLDFADAYYKEYCKFKNIEDNKRRVEFKLLCGVVRYEVETYLQSRRAPSSIYPLLYLSSVFMRRICHEDFILICDFIKRLEPDAHLPQAKLILQGKLLAVKQRIEDQYLLTYPPSSLAWQIISDLLNNHFPRHPTCALATYDIYVQNDHRIVSIETEEDRKKLVSMYLIEKIPLDP